MSRFLNYLWRFWIILLGFILTIVCFTPVYLLSIRKSDYKYAYKFVRFWCLCLFYGSGFRYELIHLTTKKIEKDKQYIIIANHTSMIDVLLPCLLFPDHPLSYVGKKELVKIPIFGTIYKRICVMVDRSSPRSRAEVYRRSAERLEEGDSMVLFPEGGVPNDTSVVLDPFKDGAFTLATKHKNPIVVLTFTGLKEMFPFDHGKGHPGKIKVYFNDILDPNEPAEVLKQYAFNQIKKVLDKHNH